MTYTLENGHDAAPDRLDALAALYDDQTVRALHMMSRDVDGGYALDVGPGKGTTTRLIAHTVGPSGRVLAIDLDLRHFPNPGSGLVGHIEAVEADIRTTDRVPAGRFDLIHARLVLSHLPERDTVLARLVDALRPGGNLIVSELDPEHPYIPDADPWAWETAAATDDGVIARVCGAFSETLAEAGADPAYGFRFPDHARLAGLDVLASWGYVARVIGWSHPAATLMRANITQRREAIEAVDWVRDGDVDRALEAIGAGVGFSMPTLYTTVARKPGGSNR